MKKLLIFLMIAIPLVIIIVVNLTVNVVSGFVSIPVDSISLNQSQIEAKIDERVSLQAEILPKNASNQEVLWASTNEEVARVDSNGNVSFIGFGSGYITVTTSDGNKRASCYFYITDTKAHEIYLTSDFKEGENYFVGINQTLQLKSIVYPAEALNKDVIYTSEDETIATVDANGLVLGKKEGKVKIVSTSVENGQISSSIIVDVVKPLEKVYTSEERAIVANSTYQISYDVYPKDATITAVQYKSSDEEIATVNSYGLVTFKKQGNVEIELTSLQGQIKDTLEIIYTNGYAYDLILEENSINEKIEKGETYINYRTLPENLDVDVSFTSDDENVVYVDDSGYVQFIGGGNTLIRAKIKKNETEYIERIISVFIESAATDIDIESEIFTAVKQIKLNPKSLPTNSTNKDFFYESTDEDIAIVSDDGVVNFICDGKNEVDIIIYANERNSKIKKTIRLIYTNGYPIDLVLENEKINLECGEFAEIKSIVYPLNIENKQIGYKIYSQDKIDEGTDVIELLGNGRLQAIGGGSAVVEVSSLKASGEKIIKFVEIVVNKYVEDVAFETDIDFNETEYVTCNPLVEFNIKCLTLDATNKKIDWRLTSNNAIRKSDNSIYFNNSGTVEIEIFSEDGNYKKYINVRYLKGKIISAELNDIQSIEVGEEYTFEIIKTLPSNASVKPYLRISNQNTMNSLDKVLEIVEGTKVRAVAGGSATVTVIVANLQYNFEITTIKKAESIEVSPANITTTNNRVKLQAKVLPEDTTDKTVEYIVEDETIASVEDGYVIFKKNGIAKITAKAVDGSDISFEFIIEKKEKGTGAITIDGNPINMLIGETNTLNFEDNYVEITYEISCQEPIEEGNDVINLDKNIVKALAIGKAEIKCTLVDEFGTEKIISIQVNVIQISEDVIFDTRLDVIQETYVTALESVNLTFKMLPEYTTDKLYNVTLLKFISQSNEEFKPYISDNVLKFTAPGTAIIRVDSNDGGTSKQFSIKYTGGDAVNATLNYEGIQTLSVGESITVSVAQWIPYNTTNTNIFIKETTHTQGVSKVVDIYNNKITAVAGGTSKILVELSNQIYKEITIIVMNKIEDIIIEESIISSKDKVVLNPVVEPANATNKTLIYSVSDTEIATISDKTVIFNKPGSVMVTISSSDGSNITKIVEVVSTFGYVHKFELNSMSLSINKGSTANLFVKKYYPSDATNKTFKFEIISNNVNGGGNNNVATVADGIIRGIYGGKAVVRVYTTDYYGSIIYQDCEIEVVSSVTDLEITFDKQLESYQGSLVIASPSISFTSRVYPFDASNENISVEIDNSDVAYVSGKTIYFKKSGKVGVRFIAEGNTNVEKSFNFYYTEGTLVGIEIDKTKFTNNKLILNAGEEYEFSILKKIPSDKVDIEFTISNKIESRNLQTLQVMDFENGIIKALNGGIATFTLKADSIEVGKFEVEVLRDCSYIIVESDEIFVSYDTVTIQAQAGPLDTYQKDLSYSIVSDCATIDSKGIVKFSQYGKAIVTITSEYNKNVFKEINIEYANEVKKISFNETASMIYSGYKVQLSVIGEPFNVAPFTVEYKSSNPNLATVDSKGVVVAQSGSGEVTISASVVGKPEITTSRTFNIVPVLSDLQLELNNELDDDLGIGGYKVWGPTFFAKDQKENEGNPYTLKYQMNIKVIKPANSGIKLVWKTSNQELATVDENGLVTFLGGVGKVTISVEPEVQINPMYPMISQYTFTLVKGINVYTYEQLQTAQAANLPTILQADLVVPKESGGIEVKANIYGNGHKISYNGNKKAYDKLVVKTSNIIIDNLHIRGTEFSEGGNLGDLEGTGKMLTIVSDSQAKKVTGVIIRNCKIENAYWGVEVRNAEALFTGCIMRNFLSSCIQLSASPDMTIPAKVKIDNSILSRALFSAILFEVRENQNINYKSELIVGENVKINNWVNLEEFNIDFVKQYTDSLGISLNDEIVRIMNKYPDFIYNYNGERYVMMGVGMFSIEVKSTSLGVILPKMASNGKAEVPAPYVYKEAHDQITLGVYADLYMWIYTLTNDQEDNTPATEYVENKELYESIRCDLNFE